MKGRGFAAKVTMATLIPALLLCAGYACATQELPRFEQLAPNVEFWSDVFTKYSDEKIVFHDPYRLELVYSILDVGDIMNGEGSERRRAHDVAKRRVAEERRIKAMLRRLAVSPPRNAEEKELVSAIAGIFHEAKFAKVLADRVRSQRGLANKFCPAMERAHAYMPKMKRILAAKGVPGDLAALPLVESAYQVGAHSSAGAAGIWQFTYGTGRLFLKIDGYRDERRDPLKATEAAAALLRQNFDKLGSWPLAITAYNHGSAGMARAVRTVGTKNLGIISESYKSRSFGFASRNFYAEFLAARDAVARAEEICGPISVDAYAPDHFELDSYVSLADLSRASGISTSRLIELNPALRPGVVSGVHRVPKGYRLNLPAGAGREFGRRYASLPASVKFVTQPETRYRVHRGETLSHIARRHGTSVSSLLSFNGLRDPRRLRAGQIIRIPSRASAAKTAVAKVSVSSRSSSAAPPPAVKDSHNSSGAALASLRFPPGKNFSEHRVGRGQTLSEIARMYKSSVAELKRLNGISDPRKLRRGATLKVPLRGAAVPAATSALLTRTHRVGRGETLWSIARNYRTTVDTLQRLSGIRNPSRLKIGQVITVPDSAVATRSGSYLTHTVRKGQTLSHIAKMYRTSVLTLKRVNRISDPRKLRPGQTLKVPN